MDDDLPKTSTPRPGPFRLGAIEVLTASNELRDAAGARRLRPLLMEILLRLAQAPGEVVRRETLLAEAWPRRMVNDEVLSRAIAELRTALDDDPRQPRYIETLPKVGYRLIAPVAPLDAAPASATRAAPGPRRRWTAPVLLVAAALAAFAWWLVAARERTFDAAVLERQLTLARPFSSDAAVEVAPRFSPDGRRIAFALGSGNAARIVVQGLDGSGRIELGEQGRVQHSPVFFPDGERIAFWSGNAAGCEIVELHLATRARRTLLDCALAPRARFDLAPDGRSLAFTGNTRPQYPAGLYVLRLDGGGPRALTAPEPGAGDDLYPRFSPDGTRVAFFRGNESHRKAWVLPLARPEDARAAAPLAGLTYGAAWLGRDGPLLVAADWLGFRALHVLDMASGKVRLAGARGARFPDVSRAGDVVYENAVYTANLWQVDAEAEPQALWPATRYTSQPQFSPDGTRLAFTSNRDGVDAIYVGTLGGAAVRLHHEGSARDLRPRWAADGRSVLAVRTTHDADGRPVQRAVRLPADGGQAEAIAALGTAVAEVRETADGRWLIWAEATGQAMRLLRAPRDDPARSERLPLPAVSAFHLNATHLVLAQPQLERLTRCGLADWICEPMQLTLAETDLFAWTLTDRAVHVRRRDRGTAWIEHRDVATDAQIGRVALPPGGTATAIAVSRDGRRIVVTREEGPKIDLVLAARAAAD